MDNSKVSCYFMIADAYTPFRAANGGPFAWKQEITLEEYKRIKKQCKEPCENSVPLIYSALVPVRTNSLANLGQDCLMPITSNYAFQMGNSVFNALTSVGAAFLDVVTLPARLLTCLPALCINSQLEIHPLSQLFIKYFGVSEEILSPGRIRVILLKRKARPIKDPRTRGTLFYTINEYWKSYAINLIRMPDSLPTDCHKLERSATAYTI